MGTGFAKKKKQARMMQEQLSKMQSDLKETEFTGTAGNGLVTVVMNGEYDLKQIKIKPECIDPEDADGLQDLIKAAHQDATKQIQKKMQMPSGMPMPGMMPF